MKAFRYFLLLFSFLFSVTVSGQQQAVNTLEWDGQQRTYALFVPDSYDSSQAVPLVVALHGTSSSAWAMMALTGLNDAAQQAGWMVVYPNALDLAWGEGRYEAGLPSAIQTETIDDVGFITALVDALALEYSIDKEQVYLTGVGGGGLMVYRTLCDAPDVFASVAVVGPLMWEYHRDQCGTPDLSTNLLVLHGLSDPLYYPENHTLTSPLDPTYRPNILGVVETIEFLAERGGCSANSAEGDNPRVFTGCNEDSTVAYYGVRDGSATWYRTGDYHLNQNGVDATETMMKFFMRDETWNTPQPQASEAFPARSYTLYVPSTYKEAEPTPLMVSLHGRFGTGAGMALITQMNRIAEENAFIVVYPDGLRYEGGAEGDFGWNYVPGANYPNDVPNDVEFLSDLVEDLAADLNIDRERVYVNGFSNGGYMVHRLACQAPDEYAAFATVAGSGFPGLPDICTHDEPVPMLIIHGTADNNVLWDGILQTVNGRQFYTSYPVVDMFGYWGQHNHCDEEDLSSENIPESGDSLGTAVRVIRFNNCPLNASVELYGIVGGGHNWPGVPDVISTVAAGDLNMDIQASQVIWDFFSRFPEGN